MHDISGHPCPLSDMNNTMQIQLETHQGRNDLAAFRAANINVPSCSLIATQTGSHTYYCALFLP